jgi:hypothetical protein
MTTTQTQTKTYYCSYCGLGRPFSQLMHNGYSFLLCPEEVECFERAAAALEAERKAKEAAEKVGADA